MLYNRKGKLILQHWRRRQWNGESHQLLLGNRLAKHYSTSHVPQEISFQESGSKEMFSIMQELAEMIFQSAL